MVSLLALIGNVHSTTKETKIRLEYQLWKQQLLTKLFKKSTSVTFGAQKTDNRTKHSCKIDYNSSLHFLQIKHPCSVKVS